MPDSALEKNDHDLMEQIFGKRIMKKVDTLLEEERPDSRGSEHDGERLP